MAEAPASSACVAKKGLGSNMRTKGFTPAALKARHIQLSVSGLY